MAFFDACLQPEQLRVHEEKEEETRLRLDDLRKKAPPLKAKGRVIQDFFFKERYLCQEVRFSLYCCLRISDYTTVLSNVKKQCAIKLQITGGFVRSNASSYWTNYNADF